jgi:arsenite methyltransferase
MGGREDELSQDLRQGVREAYSRAALKPGEKHPFPVGAALAEALGYARPLLTDHPKAADAFVGVSCLPGFAEVDGRMTVLDVGCGAGLDSLAIGPRVRRMVGLDFSAEMLARASAHLEVVQADAERMPFRSGVFDAALANGIFNLNPRREEIMAELARVLRPGGKVWGAELILVGGLDEEARSRANWFA